MACAHKSFATLEDRQFWRVWIKDSYATNAASDKACLRVCLSCGQAFVSKTDLKAFRQARADLQRTLRELAKEETA